MSEVLQIEKIFTNATRGEEASKKDLKVFGAKMDRDQIIMEILNKGDFQVSELEREAGLENVRKEIAHQIVSMCVSSKDLSLFPLSIILKAMQECKVKLNVKSPVKK